MSYDWLETLLMAMIFLSAVLFAIRHFLPGTYQSGRHFFLREKTGGLDVLEVGKTSGTGCQTKCSACDGCSLANKS